MPIVEVPGYSYPCQYPHSLISFLDNSHQCCKAAAETQLVTLLASFFSDYLLIFLAKRPTYHWPSFLSVFGYSSNTSFCVLCFQQKEGQVVTCIHIFTAVPAFSKWKVVGMYLGSHHSTVFLESGRVCLFGSNSHGQLGTGDRKQRQDACQLNLSLLEHSQCEVRHVV